MMTPAVVFVLLALLRQTSGTNIARLGRVSQSSMGHGGVPSRAIDGNRASHWGQGSCTHTNNERDPWWKLDLLTTYEIDTVIITNRADCCSERLNNAEIRIGNSNKNNGDGNPRCEVISSIGAGSSKSFECKGMKGRYVNIVIPGRVGILTLCEVEVYGRPSGIIHHSGINIARLGRVSQSSMGHGGVPSRAIDGNIASLWGQGSCTHTNNEREPWWKLDLLRTYEIYTVTITNRADCCPERLNNAEIRIGNSNENNGYSNPRCEVISSIGAGSSSSFECKGMKGRYVNIVIRGRVGILTLCEVEVYGRPSGNIPHSGINIARLGRVSQSSMGHGGVPSRANDGNIASLWGQGSCTHTNNEREPWWKLDLLSTYEIQTVIITNRGDCCPERLNNAEIRIGNSKENNGDGNPRCEVISSIGAGSSKSFECKGMKGRYVNIVIRRRVGILTLCEVEVYGRPSGIIPRSGINVARLGRVSQSSMGHGGVPSRANDGNRASHWGQGSCTHTNNEREPWWKLDLLTTYEIDTVIITNRGDCCPERLNNAEIRIGNSNENNGYSNPRCEVISSIGRGSSKSFECKGMKGRYVNIVIRGRVGILTLCEVEVYGRPSGNIPHAGTNIARLGRVSQSSVAHGGFPSRANDGNIASLWGQGSCTHTNNEREPWWKLDLLSTYEIHTVIITNRADCCHERLNNAEIRIGNSNENNGNGNPRCEVISSIGAGSSKSFDCKGMKGRYVNIVIPGRVGILTLCEVEVYGRPSGIIPHSGINIARLGKVSQSSVAHGGFPSRAIDGNRASHWGQGSCTHTNNEREPWWKLDLLKTYEIHTVTITNRGDCCPERLNNAEIRIGNSNKNNGDGNPRCEVISSIGAGSSKSFECKGMKGRYVNIVIRGRVGILTLCEVEVYGRPSGIIPRSGTNIARLGRVSQSSMAHGGVPSRANDGNRASHWGQGSCTHTNSERDPWWKLDLLKTYEIQTVTITNRGDCCPERLNNAEIRIGNSNKNNGDDNPRCEVISSIGAGSSKSFECKGMKGRYVNIVIPGRVGILTLCEVEVYGRPSGIIPRSGINIARLGRVSQSSMGHGGVPSRAIDGNRASHWGHGSCTHTNNERDPWWKLDLLRTHEIQTVTITNRGDCCPERLNNAEIRIGNSNKNNGDGNPRCEVISSIGRGSSKSFECKGMKGRYVNIVIPGKVGILTLCEVEVYGRPSGIIPHSGINIARLGRVSQSSMGHGGIPSRAIDGNIASLWGQGSCTHTNNEREPWWKLDLLKTYEIYTVTITNRADCCPERLNNAEIRIGNSNENNGYSNPRCEVISSIGAGSSKSFECKGMKGRYVNIVIRGRVGILTLCEVEVYGRPSGIIPHSGINIARLGRVSQSSVAHGGVPSRANDGNIASLWGQGSCTHTNNEREPWWKLDLLSTYEIYTVIITNRGDCCPERLNNAEIRIGNSKENNGDGNPRCEVISSIGAGSSKSFECKGMKGRYVNIVIPGRVGILTLCEVEVYGRPSGNIPHSGINIARLGRVSQSSMGHGGVPSRAIDGNRASHWGQGSCTHTNNEREPWWKLDLLTTYEIDTVIITNRADCCSERLNNAEIRIGNSNENNGNGNPRCEVISSIGAGSSKSFECKGMKGRYVNIVIRGRVGILTLCEVEVYGRPSGNIPHAGTNIARLGRVSQSSMGHGGFPSRANDGNIASLWGQGSCTHTNNEREPWWKLDLLKTYEIHTVIITNRGDCCPERLNNAEIRIGNSNENNGDGNPRCEVISSIGAGSSKSFECKGMKGRYVNIVIRRRVGILTLCEVEVYGRPSGIIPRSGTNIARLGKVSQSSVAYGGFPSRAIDGNRASHWGQGSCTHTNNEREPWWKLDLLKTYEIQTVTITNRADCCHERLNNAEIRIGNSNENNGNGNPRCEVISSIGAGSSKSFECKGMKGRYVNIVIPGRVGILTLCEVEVYGQPSGEDTDILTEYVCN